MRDLFFLSRLELLEWETQPKCLIIDTNQLFIAFLHFCKSVAAVKEAASTMNSRGLEWKFHGKRLISGILNHLKQMFVLPLDRWRSVSDRSVSN